MWHIVATGIAEVEQLNCAKDKASTILVNHNIETSTEVFILRLEKPSITENEQPPKAVKYEMFSACSDKPKYPTYVRKDLGCALHSIIRSQDCILAIAVLINDNHMKFIDVYASNKVEAPAFLATHHPLRDSLLAGDFNAHHTAWYGKQAIEIDGVLHASSRQADMLVELTTEHQYLLINSSSTPTHFPRMANRSDTVPAHRLARRHAPTVFESWSRDPDGGGD